MPLSLNVPPWTSIRLVPFSLPVLLEQVDSALCFHARHVINHSWSRTWACNDTRRLPRGTRRTIAFLCTAAKLEVNGRSQTALPRPPTVSSFSYLSISASSAAAFPGGRGLCGLGGVGRSDLLLRVFAFDCVPISLGLKTNFPQGKAGFAAAV